MTQAHGYLELGLFGIIEDDYCTKKSELCLSAQGTACAYEIYLES